jgi:hypothetical protein
MENNRCFIWETPADVLKIIYGHLEFANIARLAHTCRTGLTLNVKIFSTNIEHKTAIETWKKTIPKYVCVCGNTTKKPVEPGYACEDCKFCTHCGCNDDISKKEDMWQCNNECFIDCSSYNCGKSLKYGETYYVYSNVKCRDCALTYTELYAPGNDFVV